MADSVELTDLEVIARFSLAVRTATADRAEVIAALRSDLARLEGSRRTAAATRTEREPSRTTRTPAKKTAAQKAAKKSTRSR